MEGGLPCLLTQEQLHSLARAPADFKHISNFPVQAPILPCASPLPRPLRAGMPLLTAPFSAKPTGTRRD